MILRYWLAAVVALALLPFSPARAEWREATSEHFVVVSEGSERELTRMSQRLEAVHWLLTAATGVTPTGDVQRVKIYLVANIGQVHRAMGAANNSEVAGFYSSNINGAYAVVPRSEGEFSTTILFHEYTHHFMRQYMEQAFPLWVNEGFAEILSTASFEREGQITFGKVANHRSYELDGGAAWVPTQRMFAPLSAEDDEAGVASYGQYWLTTHYLIFEPARRNQLNQFINALNRGVPMADAYGVFTGGLEALNGELRSYMRRGSFTYRAVPLPEGVQAMPTVRVVRAGEAATMLLELQANRHLDDEERRELAGRIGQNAAQYPDDPAVGLLHARALFDLEDWASASAAADRVLAIDPANVRALAYKGWAELSAAEAAGTELSPTEASRLRGPIIRANRANPNDPVPLLAYYYSFALAGQPSPDMALQGLLRAAALAPQEDGIRMTAAMVLVARRVLPLARRTLLPVAYSPHPSPLQQQALLLVRWIDDGAQGEPPRYIPPAPTPEVADD
ncbi:MAG: hypothetical protein ABL882_10955 [Sphingopyxis sp.]